MYGKGTHTWQGFSLAWWEKLLVKKENEMNSVVVEQYTLYILVLELSSRVSSISTIVWPSVLEGWFMIMMMDLIIG